MEMRMMLRLKSSRSTFNLLSLSWKLIIILSYSFPSEVGKDDLYRRELSSVYNYLDLDLCLSGLLHLSLSDLMLNEGRGMGVEIAFVDER